MIFGIWGDDKTCKTTLALTSTKPLIHMEFDVGGFDRAKYRFKEDISAGLIKHEIYPMPFQTGVIDLEKLTIKASKIVQGIKELWYRWLINYIKYLEAPIGEVATIVVDTGTLLYEIDCMAYLQEKQELQLDAQGNLLPGERLRVQLQQIEYREPYARMRGIVYQAKAHGKHLVLTHHQRDEYKPMLAKDGSITTQQTGKKERSGWAQFGDSADVIVHTYLKSEPIPDTNPKQMKSVPYCKVELAEVLELVGMEYREPTFELINNAIRMIRGD